VHGLVMLTSAGLGIKTAIVEMSSPADPIAFCIREEMAIGRRAMRVAED
jgi:hypothetical protein